MDEQSTAAKENPLIKEFVTLVEETVGDGVLDFSHLQMRPFMKFWPNLNFHRHEGDLDDFRNVFWGTYCIHMFGKDCTGLLLSEMGYGDTYEKLIYDNMRIIKGERRVYASGDLLFQGREHKEWHQVKMPLQRNGSVNEVLNCVDFF